MCTIDDALDCEAIILNDPIVAKLVLERYGITDVKNQLVADPWYYGARTGLPPPPPLLFCSGQCTAPCPPPSPPPPSTLSPISPPLFTV